MKQPFAFFDLDHTLLSGDSDVLWCEWLMQEGLLERDRVLDDLAAPAARLIAPLEAASAAALGHVR